MRTIYLAAWKVTLEALFQCFTATVFSTKTWYTWVYTRNVYIKPRRVTSCYLSVFSDNKSLAFYSHGTSYECSKEVTQISWVNGSQSSLLGNISDFKIYFRKKLFYFCVKKKDFKTVSCIILWGTLSEYFGYIRVSYLGHVISALRLTFVPLLAMIGLLLKWGNSPMQKWAWHWVRDVWG